MIGRPLRGGRLDHRVVFVHVPKCGGSSLFRAIREKYPAWPPGRDRGLHNISGGDSARALELLAPGTDVLSPDGDLDLLRHREFLMAYFMQRRSSRFVHGHVPFSRRLHDAHPEWTWITVLRDPVGRFISHFFYNSYKPGDHARISVALDDHIDGPHGQAQGIEFVKFLGGPRDDGDYRSRAAIETAKQNLDRFDVIGRLEELDRFQEDFRRRFGVRLRIRKTNRNPASADRIRDEVTDDHRERIRRLCAPDQEVYEHLWPEGAT